MSLTYRQLAAHIAVMDDEQKDSDVTVHVVGVDEYYSLCGDGIEFSPEDDVLDKNHPFVTI